MERRTNDRMKIYWSALFHRATIIKYMILILYQFYFCGIFTVESRPPCTIFVVYTFKRVDARILNVT